MTRCQSFPTLLLPLLAAAAAAQDPAPAPADARSPADLQVIDEQLPSYPLDTCVVSGESLAEAGDEVVELVHDGRLYRLCCAGCKKEIAADPAPFAAKIEAAVIAAQLPSYPLATCPVSGEELGAMGDPLDQVIGTRLVRLCCKGCAKKLRADPAAALAVVDAALIEAQRPTYPLDTCVVSGEPLGSMGEPVEHLYGTRLVRLCCKGCVKKLRADPAAHLAVLDAAAREKGGASGEAGAGAHGGHGRGGSESGAPAPARRSRGCCG